MSEVIATDESSGVFRYEIPRTGESFSLRMCPALLMVESMAQGTAAWFGSQNAAGKPEPGVLVSVDKARFAGRPRPGDPLTVKIRRKRTFGALVMFEGEVWVHHRMLAQAEIVVRRGEAPDA